MTIRYTFMLMTLLALHSSCSNTIDYEDLLSLDRLVRLESQLHQFSNSSNAKKRINNVKVCYPAKASCQDQEKHYVQVLADFQIGQDAFEDILDKMEALQLRTYYKYNEYSLWVSGGAMGHLDGFLITNDGDLDEEMEPFELRKRYIITRGKRLYQNIYYFSGN